MEPRISLITLGVSDLEKSTRFYKDGLGLPALDGNFSGISFFKTKGTWLALYPIKELALDAGVPCQKGAFSGMTLAHNVRSVEEVDSLLKKAESVGARIVKPAEKKDWGGYSGYFSDPDGYLWEVAWNPLFWIE